jgi:hypothetical protein
MYSSTLSLTSALEGGGWTTSCPAALPPGKTQHPLYWKACGPQGRYEQVRKISSPHRDSIPGPSSHLRVAIPTVLCGPHIVFCRPTIHRLLICITKTTQVTGDRMLASPALGYRIKKMAPGLPGVLSYLKRLSRKPRYRNHTNTYWRCDPISSHRYRQRFPFCGVWRRVGRQIDASVSEELRASNFTVSCKISPLTTLLLPTWISPKSFPSAYRAWTASCSTRRKTRCW